MVDLEFFHTVIAVDVFGRLFSSFTWIWFRSEKYDLQNRGSENPTLHC